MRISKLEEITVTVLKKFLDLCMDYLAENVSGEEFKEAFEAYMFDYGDDVDAEAYPYLDNILDAATYYDTGDFREDDEHYMAEDELRATVKENLESLQTLFEE